MDPRVLQGSLWGPLDAWAMDPVALGPLGPLDPWDPWTHGTLGTLTRPGGMRDAIEYIRGLREHSLVFRFGVCLGLTFLEKNAAPAIQTHAFLI